METRLFKTKKLAEEYVRENYPECLQKISGKTHDFSRGSMSRCS